MHILKLVHVALVSTPFVPVPPRGYGGTELVVHELQRELVRAGHRVTLFAAPGSMGPDVRCAFDRPIWPPDVYAELLHAHDVAREIADEGFDVVHGHTASLVVFARELGAPLVYTLHHVHDRALVRLYEARPDVSYVAISARQAAAEPTLACTIIHHGLDPNAYPPGDGSGDYAVFLGRLSFCKGPDIAIRAALEAGVSILVGGKHHPDENPPGWKEEVLEPLLASSGVRWLGAIGLERKQRLFGGARALLMPIRWEEPFGLVMIEAMLSGCPVIAFPLGAAAEVVEEGVTGLLVDSEREMARALRRVSRIDRARCRERAIERFSSARMVRDYLGVYARALRGARAAPAGGMEGWMSTP